MFLYENNKMGETEIMLKNNILTILSVPYVTKKKLECKT